LGLAACDLIGKAATACACGLGVSSENYLTRFGRPNCILARAEKGNRRSILRRSAFSRLRARSKTEVPEKTGRTEKF
jgi:hypothetical protein